MRRRDERGMAALELAIIIPVLALVIGLTIAAGRLAHARVAVQQWADSAARSASLTRDAATARSHANAVVGSDAAGSDVDCAGGWRLDLDARGFTAPLGQAAAVRVTVTCSVPMGNLVWGLPGHILVEGASSSTLDRYRGRR